MSEQDDSPKTSMNSPELPPTPEKRFSLSKIIENIVLFIAGVAFTISLFSKNKNTETKESHKNNQKEIKESNEKTEQSQEVKNKEIKNPLPKSKITNRLGDLHSNASRKICLKLRKKITKDKFKDMLKKLGIAMGASSIVFIASWITTSLWGDILNGVYPIFKYLFSDNIPLGISISLAIIVAFSMLFAKAIAACSQKRISSLTNKYFISTLAVLALLGGAAALTIPSYTNLFREPGYTSPQQDSTRETPEKVQETPTSTPSSTGNKAAEVEQKSTSDLRLHLLYITGGVIAILGLIETNRKNSQDHIRQVHAARRDRYIEAVDKLSSKSAPVRLGGVYALVGLADEWLDDDNMDRENRVKEGQVIINNLCSYIRSPFPLAEKIDEYEARKQLEELKKKDPKSLSILDSLQLDRLNERFTDSNDDKKNKQIAANYAKIHEERDVRRTIFVEMSKRSSIFDKNEKGEIIKTTSRMWSDFDFDFSRALIFYPLNNLIIEQGNFASARFYGEANFEDAAFIGNTYFEGAVFTGYANFQGAEFTGYAKFQGAEFTGNANFMGAEFTGDTNFWRTKFIGNAHFGGAMFTGDANFWRTEFTGYAHFEVTEFTSNADFTKATFTQETDFGGAIFTQKVNFHNALFENYEPTFVNEEWRARFSSQRDQKDYVFSADQNGEPIHRGIATLDGKPLKIPLGAVLFNPDSGRTSDPAK